MREAYNKCSWRFFVSYFFVKVLLLFFLKGLSYFLSPKGVSRCDGLTKFFKEDNVDLTGGRDMARSNN